MRLTKRSALKLIADFETAVREHTVTGVLPADQREGIQRRYDFEHTKLLTRLTQD